MRHHTRFAILAATAGLALAAFAWLALRAPQRKGAASMPAALEAAVAEVVAGRRTTPIIGEPAASGEATVTFLARREGGLVPRIVSDVTGWGENTDGTFDFTAGRMTRVGHSEWYSLEATVAPRARVEYLIAYAPADYRIDPYNPRQAAGPRVGGARASEFVMPGYVTPREFEDPAVAPAGSLTEATVQSPALGAACRLIVYIPAGYRNQGEYPVAVLLDLRSNPVSRVLDSLIARRAIEPIVAVLVGPTARGAEHAAGPPLRAFLTEELPAWLASRYAVAADAGGRAIMGISYGAKDALDAALGCGERPDPPAAVGCRTDAFGRLGLLIPGRRIVRADLESVAGRRGRRLRVAILAGLYDRANVGTARGLRQALADAGHAVDYIEVPEGHSAVTWTTHLSDLFVSLFGPVPANSVPGRMRP
jgi:enterochelin esterase-like enzyme